MPPTPAGCNSRHWITGSRQAGVLAAAAAAEAGPASPERPRDGGKRPRAAVDDRDLLVVSEHDAAWVTCESAPVDVHPELLAGAAAVAADAACVEADAPFVEELAKRERHRPVGLDVDQAARA